MKKKVLVAMSGGVDSSVAAYFLIKEGYEVIGVTFDLFQSSCQINSLRTCHSLGIFEDAKEVAEKLKISHHILNLKEEFKNKIINYFLEEYRESRTPNPCIKCNEKIKFTTLLNKAKDLDANYIATGHYAKVTYDKDSGSYLLRKGADLKKDQSYVLFSLNQEQLSHTIFPLGNYKKEDIRKVAKDLKIKVHNKPESREICFILDNDYRKFLKENQIFDKIGFILDKNGNVLGEHLGTHYFTIGQRRGLGVAKGKPLYVIKIDKEKNAVIVGEEENLLRDELIASEVNWVAGKRPDELSIIKAKIRYTHKEADAWIYYLSSTKVRVKFKNPQQAITPGQAVVFYQNETLLGGGWIN